MSHSVLIAMLSYMNDLQRSINANEIFADEVLVLVHEMDAVELYGCAPKAMSELVLRHRVEAIKARAKMDAIIEQFVRRFGADRLEQERSKHPARPRRPI